MTFLYMNNRYTLEQLVNIFKLSTIDETLNIKGA